ncbi:SipW-dependent-type signal peptide-containing protein [Arthrobacter castelli]|uniref:SipW-dependent-type signal peptide-containing protein n=1 Tax=Arthrobacter castelli TaxID=271431 RepID=UPI000421B913|nr:SipW-dependent-type signal peptide-containing protein [Arthrobacter castelli]
MSSTRKSSGKIRAILAGGLVLGVGAAITLAAWNDSEFATGEFTAGEFNLQGSTNGTDFTEHSSAGDAATLPFSVDTANLTPGDVVTSPFAVRLDNTTDYDANVAVSTATTTGSVAGLTYRLVQTSEFGCANLDAGTVIVPAGTPLGTTPASASFALAQSADGSSPGAPANLCFEVTAGDISQGQSGTATWEFAAESN